MSFLELHDIRKAYTLNHQENVILKGINLNFERGGVYFHSWGVWWW